MYDKPVILWSCDVKGWAYDGRIQTMRRALPHYEHRVWITAHVPPSLWQGMMQEADLIVCQGVKVVERTVAAGADPRKIVCRIDSIRVDNNGAYVDIFTKPEAPHA
jgi:hypothetical protein